MKILVVGGTRYFGIPMVNTLLRNGHEITIATRGNSKPEFEGSVDYVAIDRMDSKSVKETLGGQHFDLIIDKIAYSSNDVKALLEKRPAYLHVVLTGRDAREEIVELADLVTEMRLVKHPYQKGIRAQKGIEF